jgi:hypothetical protein
VVTGSDGTTYDFHATALLDGSRQIEPGTDVTFIVRAGRRGRYEASALTVRDGGSSHQVPA